MKCILWSSLSLVSVSDRCRRRRNVPLRTLEIAVCGLRRPQATSTTKSSAEEQPLDAHVLINTYDIARREAEIAVETAAPRGRGRPPKRKRVRESRGFCGQYDSSGKFHKCAKPFASEKSGLFCRQCLRYFHLECFFDAHQARLMQ